MQARLTVPQIFNIQNSQCATKNINISQLFITQEFMYLIDQKQTKNLKVLSLKNFQLLSIIMLPTVCYNKKINSIASLNGIICIVVDGCNDLIYFNGLKKWIHVISHLEPINQMINYKNSVVTCSDDFTIRVWNEEHGSIVQSKAKHVYFGHSAQVTCLQTYQDVLLSGSKDKSVIFWKNNEIYCSYKNNSSIKNILRCSQSDQLVVFSQNGDIGVMSWNNIIRSKRPQILRVIKYNISNSLSPSNFKFCDQIDQSFILFSDQNNIIFVQINLGEIISKKQLSEINSQNNENIIGLKCIGRMLLFGKQQANVSLLRF